jgi:hypothetical protein
MHVRCADQLTRAAVVNHHRAMGPWRRCVALAACAGGAVGCGNVKNQSTPDAAPVVVDATRYDVGYVTEITFGADRISGFLVVVNQGAEPLPLATASVVAYFDDVPTVTWGFAKIGNATTLLASGRAAGLLSPQAASQITGRGLVAEPIDDQVLNFEMTLTPLPDSGTNLRAQAVVRIGTANIVLPFTIRFLAGAALQINSTARVSSQP